VQHVSVPAGDVERLEAKELDQRRTAYVAIGVGVAILTLIERYASGTFGGTTTASGTP
jgi:hypothetical protein